MKLPPFILIILFLFNCCINQGNQENTSELKNGSKTDKEIEDLILKNKSKQLFLSFWDGIDENDFKIIKGYETKKGNLIDSSFIISVKMPKGYTLSDDNIQDYKFGVNLQFNSILLIHHDSYFTKIDSRNHVSPQYGLKRKNEFILFKNHLINLYDKKYERIIDTTDNDIYVWRKISLGYNTVMISLFPYFGFFEKRNGKVNMLGKQTWDFWNGSKEYRELSYNGPKLDNFQLGLSRFMIYYQTKEEYFFQRDFRANESKRAFMEKTKEQTEKERAIEKSKSNL